MDGAAAVEVAQQLADDLLFPSAPATDAADVVPLELLDTLAAAGLYGLAGPAEAGGLGADLATTCAVIETLAGGCLTTTFVWAQHLGAVLATATSSDDALASEWTPRLCRGETRAGLALAGMLPGPPLLRARRAGAGWVLDGRAPWVSGWGRIDVLHTAARGEDGNVVWLLVDARESGSFSVEPLELVALQATATVRATFRSHPVPAGRMTSTEPHEHASPPSPIVLRIHASFALGVAARCCRLLGPSPLDEELAACRARLDHLDADTIGWERAFAANLALRAAAATMAAGGSTTLLRDGQQQRLAREALFLLVYAARPPVRAASLDLLGATATTHARRSSR